MCGSLEVEADDVPWVETKLDGRESMDIHVKRIIEMRRLGRVPAGGERGGRLAKTRGRFSFLNFGPGRDRRG